MTTLPSGLPVVVERADPVPLAVQISAQLEAAVTDGVLHAGDRLPSSRDLAVSLGVSRTVVTNAYARLFAEGWLEGRHGSGTYVADVAAPPRRPGSTRFPADPSLLRGSGTEGANGPGHRGSDRRGQTSRTGGRPGRRSICSPASPGRTGSSPPPGGAHGGRRARTSRPGGPTRTGSRSFGRKSPPTCAGRADLRSGRSRS